MLSDPLYLGVIGSWSPDVDANTVGGETAVFHTLSTGDRTSKRRASGITSLSGSATDQLNLSISHSESKENSPYGTTRTNIRLDVSRLDANGKSVSASVYQVTVRPNADLFTDADILLLQKTLGRFITFGDTTDAALHPAEAADTMTRLLSGEA